MAKPNQNVRKAIILGQEQAKKILAKRRASLRQRDRVLRQHPAPLQVGITPFSSTGRPAASSAVMKSAGILVAEGDSWFNYPFHDVLSELEDRFGYDISSVAHAGDQIEEMAYGDGQLLAFTRVIEKLLRRQTPPKAILLSGGGNDVAGAQFSMFLNHALSPIAGLDFPILEEVINTRIQTAFAAVLTAVTKVCGDLGNPMPILVHGYDYPVPDGRGFWGGGWGLPGPWLEPGFREKGFKAMDLRISMARNLIDRFNDMLQQLLKLSEFQHVHYVNLRGTLSTGADYKNWWDNELHPTHQGFTKIAQMFDNVIKNLPST
ncbi:MAG: hypothetical protein PCFJNLEI_01986 [Verrucomicrobiae bacterium]|nr:hypothetical protein [Verrucomicrobiae bacterium]